jgi:hypothetical protein
VNALNPDPKRAFIGYVLWPRYGFDQTLDELDRGTDNADDVRKGTPAAFHRSRQLSGDERLSDLALDLAIETPVEALGGVEEDFRADEVVQREEQGVEPAGRGQDAWEGHCRLHEQYDHRHEIGRAGQQRDELRQVRCDLAAIGEVDPFSAADALGQGTGEERDLAKSDYEEQLREHGPHARQQTDKCGKEAKAPEGPDGPVQEWQHAEDGADLGADERRVLRR